MKEEELENNYAHPRNKLGSEQKTYSSHSDLLSETELQDDQDCLADSVGSMDTLSLEKVNIVDDEMPETVMERFDSSQIAAVRNALKSEISIIQGPPGCGKTFVGKEIIKVLLNNQGNCRQDGGGCEPILVLCYTNHALDQFMEGICEFYNGGVLRVGGRSRSDKLKSRNLSSLRTNMRKARSIPDYIYKGKKAKRGIMHSLRIAQNSVSKQIQILRENIIHEHSLLDEMGSDIVEQFEWERNRGGVFRAGTNCSSSSTSMICDWLCIEEITKDVEHYIQQHGIKQIIAMDGQRQQHRDEGDDISDPFTHEYHCFAKTDLKFDDDDIDDKLNDFTQRHVSLIVADIERMPQQVTNQNWKFLRWSRRELSKRIRELLRRPSKLKQDPGPGLNIYHLNMQERWDLYNYWVDKKCIKLASEIENRINDYKSTYGRYEEVLMLENEYIMRMADVIGMTTTCAAKHSVELKNVKPKIIIAEEAAEIFESHLVTNISKGCQQLILIGDHKQLRPRPNNYKLGKDFNLDVSLFERLIMSGMKYTTLSQQHRMRPLIAENVRKIYPHVYDHPDVEGYDDVKGMKHNMVFMKHNHNESADGSDSKSRRNPFEALFSIRLARYLIQQGYSPDEVTILTTYKGQMYDIMRLKRNEELLQGMTVTVVDNFQGEESDIVILSLVRSNAQGKIGFLSKDNRVCVALSRAKIGLYVLGNFHMYNTKLWTSIITYLTTQSLILPAIPLQCQNHPNAEPTLVSTADDFDKVPAGSGCTRQCEFIMSCGHRCYKSCHLEDKEHEKVKCTKPCERTCLFGHPCKLSCGDVCKCTEKVEITPSCGHKATIPCFKQTGYKCQVRCNMKLACGHICSGTCYECFQGRLHKPCQRKCQHKLICNHPCNGTCNSCVPCQLSCDRFCPHGICTKKCNEVCQVCCEPCTWTCIHYTCTKPCGEPCDRSRCNKKCPEVLNCGHNCIGLCGEPCLRFCPICRRKEFEDNCFGGKQFPESSFVQLDDCGHAVEYELLDGYFDDGKETTLRQCPICSKPIYHCMRYGAVLKRMLKHIDKMKTKLVRRTWLCQIVSVFDAEKELTDYLVSHNDFDMEKAFTDYLVLLNERNIEVLRHFIASFNSGKDGILENLRSSVAMPSLQWISDITNEVYRACDHATINEIGQEIAEKTEATKQISSVRAMVLSRKPYTNTTREPIIELARSVYRDYGKLFVLANITLDVQCINNEYGLFTDDDILHSESSVAIDPYKEQSNSPDNSIQNDPFTLAIASENGSEEMQTSPREVEKDTSLLERQSTTYASSRKVDVLALPKKLVMYTTPCPEYYKCEKMPVPEEFERIIRSESQRDSKLLGWSISNAAADHRIDVDKDNICTQRSRENIEAKGENAAKESRKSESQRSRDGPSHSKYRYKPRETYSERSESRESRKRDKDSIEHKVTENHRRKSHGKSHRCHSRRKKSHGKDRRKSHGKSHRSHSRPRKSHGKGDFHDFESKRRPSSGGSDIERVPENKTKNGERRYNSSHGSQEDTGSTRVTKDRKWKTNERRSHEQSNLKHSDRETVTEKQNVHKKSDRSHVKENKSRHKDSDTESGKKKQSRHKDSSRRKTKETKRMHKDRERPGVKEKRHRHNNCERSVEREHQSTSNNSDEHKRKENKRSRPTNVEGICIIENQSKYENLNGVITTELKDVPTVSDRSDIIENQNKDIDKDVLESKEKYTTKDSKTEVTTESNIKYAADGDITQKMVQKKGSTFIYEKITMIKEEGPHGQATSLSLNRIPDLREKLTDRKRSKRNDPEDGQRQDSERKNSNSNTENTSIVCRDSIAEH